MALYVEHELHRRRWSRNAGLGLVLAALIAVVFGITVVKVKQGGWLEGYDHRAAQLPPVTQDTGAEVTP